MANSDKNILITPNISAATGVYPTIKFNGANNTPINLSVLDDGTISFSSTAGQLFSISDGLTGTIFSVNDISGIPSIEVLDTGLVKINQYGGSTVFGSSAAIQNASSVNAKVSISTVSATTPGLIIKGVSSQSANLQEWQSSDGTVLSNIGSNGTVTLKSIASSNIATFFNGTNGYGAGNINYAGTFNINGANMGFPYTSSGAVLAVNATYAGSLPISVRGYASQTADLQQWQNSAGTVLARVLYNGNIESPIVSAGSLYAQTGDLSVAYGGYFGGGVGGNYIGAAVSVIPWTTTTIGVIVRGRASQSADLQQWQNSANTVLVKIAADGSTTFASPIVGFVGNSGSYSSTAVSGYNIIHLSQGMILINSQTGGDYNLATNVYYNSGWKYFESAGSTLINFGNGRFDFNTASSGTAGNAITYTSKMIIANSGTVTINGFGAGSQGLIIKGAASQTADLQQWQDSSGSVLTHINNIGRMTINSSTDAGGAAFYVFQPNGGYGVRIQGAGTAGAGLWIDTVAGGVGAIIRGAGSQTANLQEWQNSAGSVLAKVDASGNFMLNGITMSQSASSVTATNLGTTNNRVYLKEENSGGQVRITKSTAAAANNRATDLAQLYLRDGTTPGTLKLVIIAGTAGAETTILDNIPQS